MVECVAVWKVKTVKEEHITVSIQAIMSTLINKP